MTKALLRLAQWLYDRFPPKVMLTEESFDALVRRIGRLETESTGEHLRLNTLRSEMIQRIDATFATATEQAVFDRVEVLEAKLAELAKALTAPKQTESAAMRAAFARGEFPRTGSRADLEAKA